RAVGPPPRGPLPRLRGPPRALGLPSMAGQGGERPLPPGPEPPGLSAPLDAPDLPDTGGRGRGFWYGLVPLWGEAVGLGNGGGDAAGPEAAGRGKAFGPQAAGEPGLPVGAFLPGLGGLVPLPPAPRGLGVAVRRAHLYRHAPDHARLGTEAAQDNALLPGRE